MADGRRGGSAGAAASATARCRVLGRRDGGCVGSPRRQCWAGHRLTVEGSRDGAGAGRYGVIVAFRHRIRYASLFLMLRVMEAAPSAALMVNVIAGNFSPRAPVGGRFASRVCLGLTDGRVVRLFHVCQRARTSGSRATTAEVIGAAGCRWSEHRATDTSAVVSRGRAPGNRCGHDRRAQHWCHVLVFEHRVGMLARARVHLPLVLLSLGASRQYR